MSAAVMNLLTVRSLFQAGVAVLLSYFKARSKNTWPEGLADFKSEVVNYRREAEIYTEDGPPQNVWLVVKGAVRSLTTLADGRRQIIAFHFPGDLLGLKRSERYSLRAEAICHSQLLRIGRTKIDQACIENLALVRLIEGLTAEAVQRGEEHSLLLGRMTATERVAAFLLEMDRRLGAAHGGMRLRMTRRDIADYLGLTEETVSRVLALFKRQGIVKITNGKIVICRRKPLMDALGKVRPMKAGVQRAGLALTA
jgi:CRP/FNR family nitrogen fixation transcriptional regulator